MNLTDPETLKALYLAAETSMKTSTLPIEFRSFCLQIAVAARKCEIILLTNAMDASIVRNRPKEDQPAV